MLFLDGHLMSRVNHGYANTYGTTTVPTAAPGPRAYMTETLFPAVRNQVRRDFGLEVFTHALATPDAWPPKAWSHDRAAWTVEVKFIVNDFGPPQSLRDYHRDAWPAHVRTAHLRAVRRGPGALWTRSCAHSARTSDPWFTRYSRLDG